MTNRTVGTVNESETDSPMRIHVAVVGLNRAPRACFPSIDDYVMRPLETSPNLMVTRSLTLIRPHYGRIRNPRSGESGWVPSFVPSTWRARALRLGMDHLAKEVHGERVALEDIGDTWGDNFTSLRNYLVFLAAMKHTWNEAPEIQDADVVVFCRPDIRITQNIAIRPAVEWSLPGPLDNPSRVAVPHWRFEGISDRFAVMSRSAAAHYFTRIDTVRDHTFGGEPFHSEGHLERVFAEGEVMEFFPPVFVRVRLGGRPEPRDLRQMARTLEERPNRWGLSSTSW